MKYKIGDKVTLRKDLQDGETYNGITLWEGIKAILEAEPYLEIISITDEANYETHTNYIISHSMIEGLLKPKATKYELIITDTNKVIILDKENGRKGIATCSKDDEYSIYKGFEIAWNRLNEIGTVMNLDTINLSPMKSPENNPNYIVHKNGNPLNKDLFNLTESERRILAKQLADDILKEIEMKIGKIK